MQAAIFPRPQCLIGFLLGSMLILCATVGNAQCPAAAKEEAVILTPPPPATPRINGAKIFGVRPGHPFLFTIPATGQRPMEFAVDDLPAGLKVDPQSGQIAGSLKDRGEYAVTFRAKNALGEAKRPFKIVCGDTLALTPHMGWNSWYIWIDHVTDKIMREAADAMVANGMINHGYMYVNIDDCWAVHRKSADPPYGGQPRDAQGNVNPNRRFPDMKALADYIHGKGLKAGLYTSPGPIDLRRLRRGLRARRAGRPAICRLGIRFPEIRLVLVWQRRARIPTWPPCKSPIARWAISSKNSTATWC